jgi:cell division control protein 7
MSNFEKETSRRASEKLPDPAHFRAGTRGYRAPEVLARAQLQTCALDIWSAGCILLSIMTHHYPFFNCQDDATGLAEILTVLHPARGDVVSLTLAGQMVTYEQHHSPPFDLEAYCRHSSQLDWPNEAFELLRAMLQIDPAKRITAAAALEHRFFKHRDIAARA